jgi:hypothetical protein
MSESDVHELLARFASTISGGPLGTIDNAPDAAARPLESIKNVLKKIQRDGGRALFGWVFLNRGSPHGEYLIALHHAVWSPEAGTAIVDITPLHDDPKFRPYCPSPARVLFLLDESAEPKMIGRRMAPLPSRFFPVTDDPNLAAYVEQLNTEERMQFEKLGPSGIDAPEGQRTH